MNQEKLLADIKKLVGDDAYDKLAAQLTQNVTHDMVHQLLSKAATTDAERTNIECLVNNMAIEDVRNYNDNVEHSKMVDLVKKTLKCNYEDMQVQYVDDMGKVTVQLYHPDNSKILVLREVWPIMAIDQNSKFQMMDVPVFKENANKVMEFYKSLKLDLSTPQSDLFYNTLTGITLKHFHINYRIYFVYNDKSMCFGFNDYEMVDVCNVCSRISYLQCSRCKQAKYCSRECQKKQWSTHKSECVEN